MKKAILVLCFIVFAAAIAQQTVPPTKTPYTNYTQGLQFNGSWGTAGSCIVSTGTGSIWGACPGGLPGVTSDGNMGVIVQGASQGAICDTGGQVYNVKCYGAKGDGTTNDTTAIQTTINAAAGRQVYLPSGTYIVKGTLSYVTNVQGVPGLKMYGDGIARSIIQCTAPFTMLSSGCIEMTGVDATHLNAYADGGWLRDLMVTASGSLPANMAGVSVLGQWRLKIERVRIINMPGDGVYWPLRTDISSNPDQYASVNDFLLQDSIDSNNGNGINEECGLCAAIVTIMNNRIGGNAKDGIVVAGHITNIIGNTIFGNGSGAPSPSTAKQIPSDAGGTIEQLTTDVANCVGGGVRVVRVQTGPIGGVIKGNGDFDSNCLYQVWLQSSAIWNIENNRFISHGNGAVYTQTKLNIPTVAVKLGYGGTGVSSTAMRSNFIRSDPVVSGTPDSSKDSSVTYFQIEYPNVSDMNVSVNNYGIAGNTGNITPYSPDGGAMITCTGTGTPTCTIKQGGYYGSTPTLSVPAGFGCSGTPTATLTGTVLTAVNMAPVTGCTSAPPYLILSANPYPSSNTFGIQISDVNGTQSSPSEVGFNGFALPAVNPTTGLYTGGSGLIFIRDRTGAIAQRFCVSHSWTDNGNYSMLCLNALSSSAYSSGVEHAGTGAANLSYTLKADTGILFAPDQTTRFSMIGTNFNCSSAGTCNIGTANNPNATFYYGTVGANMHFAGSFTNVRTATFQDANGTVAYTSQLSPVRAGAWSISAATSAAVTFATAMGSTPSSCAVTPGASAATTGTPFVTSLATTGFTVNVPTSGSLSGTYQCVINNAN
jgi:hypothetical protein